MTAHWTRRLTAGALLLTGCGGRTSESLFERTNQPDAPAAPTTEWSTPGRPDVPVPEPAPVVVPDPEEIECPLGELACGDSCVDIEVDAEHCGACNAPCDAGLVCAAGQCELGPRNWKAEAALSLPRDFDDDNFQIVLSDSGVVVLLWNEFLPGTFSDRLFSSRLDPSDNSWSAPVQLGTDSPGPGYQLILHPDGYPIVVWREGTTGHYAADKDLDGEWPLPTVFESTVAGLFQVAVTETGNLWFAWSSEGRILVGTQGTDGRVEGQLAAEGGPIDWPRFAASDEQAVVTWIDLGPDHQKLNLTARANGSWGPRSTWDDGLHYWGSAAADGEGHSIAVWPRDLEGVVEVVASVNGSPPEPISDGEGFLPSARRTKPGEVVVAWHSSSNPVRGADSTIRSRRFVDGEWQEVQEIGSGSGETEVIGPTIGASATGHVAVAFRVRGETPRIWLNRFSPGVDGWQGASEVPGQSTWGYSPTAATNSFGDVAVAWKSGRDEPAIQVRLLTR